MTDDATSRILRDLDLCRQDSEDLRARLLRLQEEQGRTLRDLLRSRSLIWLGREAQRIADTAATADAIGGALLGRIHHAAECDRAAFLSETPCASGDFVLTHAVGLGAEDLPRRVHLADPPSTLRITTETRLDPLVSDLVGILRCPCVSWVCDRDSGQALILGYRAEPARVSAIESFGQEFVAGALALYSDLRARKDADLQLRRAAEAAGQAATAMAGVLDAAETALRAPLNAILGASEQMASGSRYPLTIDDCARFADQIHESGHRMLALLNDMAERAGTARATLARAGDWHPATALLAAAIEAAAAQAAPRRVQVTRDLPAEGTVLRVDPAAFGPALAHLLRDAVRLTPDDGRVTVALRERGDGAAEIVLRTRLPGAPRWDTLASIVLPADRIRTPDR